MLYSLFVMIGDTARARSGAGSGHRGQVHVHVTCPVHVLRSNFESSRAGPGEEEELEEEKSSATRFELGDPKGALRFDETTPSPGGRATAAARGTAAGGSAVACCLCCLQHP